MVLNEQLWRLDVGDSRKATDGGERQQCRHVCCSNFLLLIPRPFLQDLAAAINIRVPSRGRQGDRFGPMFNRLRLQLLLLTAITLVVELRADPCQPRAGTRDRFRNCGNRHGFF